VSSEHLTIFMGEPVSRYFRAATLSSLAVLCVLAIAIIVTGLRNREGEILTPAAIGHLLLLLLMFGWPAVFAVTGLIAVVAHKCDRSVAAMSRLQVLGIGTFTGIVMVPVTWGSIWGEFSDLRATVFLGALAGAAAAWTFRRVIGTPPSSPEISNVTE
jgi:hypothetical protein